MTDRLYLKDYRANGFDGSYGEYKKLEKQRLADIKAKEEAKRLELEREDMISRQKQMYAMQIEKEKNKPKYMEAEYRKASLEFDQSKSRQESLRKMAEMEQANNERMATHTDGEGTEETFHPKEFMGYQAASEKRLAAFTGGGNDLFSKFQSESPERQAEIMEKYKAAKASKTNEWGNDLTKDAPSATTTYQDGKRTWSYPGVKNPKTGEVRGSMSITSPYGSEEEYQNRGGVVGQNPDGSWKWDKNAKGGGGFFQRGGLSDLGRALAGDAPRRVPVTPSTRPLLDQYKYASRIAKQPALSPAPGVEKTQPKLITQQIQGLVLEQTQGIYPW